MAEKDWDQAAADYKRQTRERGFCTIDKDKLRDTFGIGRMTEATADKLSATFEKAGVGTFPHPYYAKQVIRLYDIDQAVWKIGIAFLDPDNNNELPLTAVSNLYAREHAAKDKRSDDVPWIQALDVFFQLIIGRPPEGWEDLDNDREPHELIFALAESLGLPEGVAIATETKRLGGSVCAFRVRRPKWESVPDDLASVLSEADRKQRDIFDAVLHAAAKHILHGNELPSRQVELGRLGLRYRREAQGGIGWIR